MFNKSYLRFAVPFFAIVLVVAGGYLIWSRYFKYDPVRAYEKAEKAYVEAMTADTYGGKTPQETLDLFVAALRAGDVELASKYFMLDDNLSRQGWVDYLTAVKEKGLLSKMAEDIATKSVPGNITNEAEFGYVLFNKDGTVGVQIDMRLNTYTKAWKIEGLF
jgi:hypothetical protein